MLGCVCTTWLVCPFLFPEMAKIKLIAILLLLAACSSVPVQPGPGSVVIDTVPFYAQEDYQCGPASLAGVMNFWGMNVTPDEVAREIYSDSAKGTLNIDMLFYARKKGLDALQYAGSWDDLKAKINDRQPLVVLVDYGFYLYQANHFMVITGYNEDGVVANSGKDERVFIGKNSFLKSWKRTNYWTLLIRTKLMQNVK